MLATDKQIDAVCEPYIWDFFPILVPAYLLSLYIADARVHICNSKEVAKVPQIDHDVGLVLNRFHEDGVELVNEFDRSHNRETGEKDHNQARDQDPCHWKDFWTTLEGKLNRVAEQVEWLEPLTASSLIARLMDRRRHV